jgi:hypothetical protein
MVAKLFVYASIVHQLPQDSKEARRMMRAPGSSRNCSTTDIFEDALDAETAFELRPLDVEGGAAGRMDFRLLCVPARAASKPPSTDKPLPKARHTRKSKQWVGELHASVEKISPPSKNLLHSTVEAEWPKASPNSKAAPAIANTVPSLAG